jgi:hypothetical protein
MAQLSVEIVGNSVECVYSRSQFQEGAPYQSGAKIREFEIRERQAKAISKIKIPPEALPMVFRP